MMISMDIVWFHDLIFKLGSDGMAHNYPPTQIAWVHAKTEQFCVFIGTFFKTIVRWGCCFQTWKWGSLVAFNRNSAPQRTQWWSSQHHPFLPFRSQMGTAHHWPKHKFRQISGGPLSNSFTCCRSHFQPWARFRIERSFIILIYDLWIDQKKWSFYFDQWWSMSWSLNFHRQEAPEPAEPAAPAAPAAAAAPAKKVQWCDPVGTGETNSDGQLFAIRFCSFCFRCK